MWLLEREYDIKVEQRAVRNEHLRDQHNRTSCRSPSREADVLWFKQEQRHKRQLEFAKRRPPGVGPTRFRVTTVRRPSGTRLGPLAREALTSTQRLLITRGSMGIPKDDVKSTLQTTCNGQLNSTVKAREFTASKQAHLNIISTMRMQVHKKRTISTKRERDILVGIDNQKRQQSAGIQTEPGFVTVKEDDVLLLTDYLQEALQREEALRMKLTTLQRSTGTLLRSSEYLWKTRCGEDLLKSQIKALESQLQVCMKGLPQDGVKRLLVDMEKEKGEQEATALQAIQKGTEDMAKAEARIQHLKESLQAARTESSQWQSLCEELRGSSTQLRKGLDVCTEQLQQLHTQLEISQGRESELGQQLESVQQVDEELRSRLAQLEDDKRAVSAQLQEAKDMLSRRGPEVFTTTRALLASEGRPAAQISREGDHVVGQLRVTEEKLKMKERECMELQAQLEALELECRTYQSSVTQCREELRQLRNRRNSKSACGSWLVLLLLLLVLGVALLVGLCLCYPLFADYLHDIYSCLEQHVEDYLLALASPQNSACFRPI
ncbi:TRAF3-interacting JNK-activating modulator isoform X1 [Alosa sapidissima]|uniref:TRAF3-interacting JNK-activating modulator isoform X1 n=1 Tax=Alosa sapidissima TaxID=34773 RepID=UPI001C085A50|nr:TRAF3-interacting JNK-activating modulator isoform X1 [Alosa sapidissima]XP_041954360.1 TRAF3-interacting JNK-activating modulator isoform X1 [Alosa sapidissima]XP_041954361.1 TRAF3-interacting JNK-activating modulator isoform X1 [Alosa sapidissima]XP_041954362.1 TRAF3-interacting JNK-activating modulator isoform X1 [Alosa sapidissima]XP_041954363.1 TRAF3-interacting JNK-activating modulator isoform X1 [Alosa sapidissima]XP_041954364.1 TRAF3-interacting JNK-activating modulator isoform X1 [